MNRPFFRPTALRGVDRQSESRACAARGPLKILNILKIPRGQPACAYVVFPGGSKNAKYSRNCLPCINRARPGPSKNTKYSKNARRALRDTDGQSTQL